MSELTQSPAWRALQAERQALQNFNTFADFASEPQRLSRLTWQAAGLLLDGSKQRLRLQTYDLLLALAEQENIEGQRAALWQGEPINNSENRAVMHMALRAPADASFSVSGKNVMPDVLHVRRACADFVAKLQSGAWLGATGQPIKNVINIGIGGSDLGPRLVYKALQHTAKNLPQVHFVANVDAADLLSVLAKCEPATTLIIIVSKTFTTQETMLNASTAKDWLLNALGKNAIAQHMVAVSTNLEAVAAFGIPSTSVFGFWDWVGGRFSLWGAVGLAAQCGLPPNIWQDFLAGAAALDQHFVDAPLAQNMPVALALLGLWNSNFCGHACQAILPYDQRLNLLPDFLQQLEMESNGKSVDRTGHAVDYTTAPVLFGSAGTNGQHAFYQLLHQGTQIVPADFILTIADDFNAKEHKQVLLAHGVAQSEALLQGRMGAGVSAAQYCAGNRPSNTILLPRLDAAHLGALIALYEHKVFVQGALWRINSFDQWGVELGKILARPILQELANGEKSTHDASTQQLLRHISLY